MKYSELSPAAKKQARKEVAEFWKRLRWLYRKDPDQFYTHYWPWVQALQNFTEELDFNEKGWFVQYFMDSPKKSLFDDKEEKEFFETELKMYICRYRRGHAVNYMLNWRASLHFDKTYWLLFWPKNFLKLLKKYRRIERSLIKENTKIKEIIWY